MAKVCQNWAPLLAFLARLLADLSLSHLLFILPPCCSVIFSHPSQFAIPHLQLMLPPLTHAHHPPKFLPSFPHSRRSIIKSFSTLLLTETPRVKPSVQRPFVCPSPSVVFSNSSRTPPTKKQSPRSHRSRPSPSVITPAAVVLSPRPHRHLLLPLDHLIAFKARGFRLARRPANPWPRLPQLEFSSQRQQLLRPFLLLRVRLGPAIHSATQPKKPSL